MLCNGQDSTPSSHATVAVVGMGSIGGIAAGFLSHAGTPVLACAREPLASITVETEAATFRSRLEPAESPAACFPVRWVLLCTKAQDTAGAGTWLDRLTGARTTVAVLQNGIDHVARVAPLVHTAAILPVLVFANGERLAAGRVRYRAATSPDFVVPAGPYGDAFAALFASTGLRVERVDDFVTFAWRKLLFNSVANPITALTLQRQHVLAKAEIRELALSLFREALPVARAAGAQCDESDAESMYATLLGLPPGGGTSMYFDRLAGRTLEDSALTGTLVRIADRYGIDVPRHRALAALLRTIAEHPQRIALDAAADRAQ